MQYSILGVRRLFFAAGIALGLISIAISFTPVPLSGAADGGAVLYEWGTEFDRIKRMVSGSMTVEQFTPVERPKYKNTVLKYALAADRSLADSIVILRVKKTPVIDYLFIKNRLYNIVEEWDTLDEEADKELRARLESSYGVPQVETDRELTIYSYDVEKNSVRYYRLRQEGGKLSGKVYYYPNDLFKMLMKQ